MRPRAATMAAGLVALAVVAGLVAVTGDDANGALIVVTTAADELDATPNATCSLREAITSANRGDAVGGCTTGSITGNTIAFARGVDPVLTLAGPAEDFNARGDLDVSARVRIAGPPGGSVLIAGTGIDRVFDVRPEGRLTLDSVTVRGGTIAAGEGGGGIRNEGLLELFHVTVTDNIAVTGDGGGILNAGGLTIEAGTISRNRADRGGGLANVSLATAELLGVTISGNQAVAGGAGAVDVRSGSVTIDSGTITLNTRAGTGVGGIFSATPGGATLERTIVADNADPQCGSGDRGAIVSGGHNLMSDATCNPNRLDVTSQTPRLGPLSSNGGATETHLPEASSMAVDAVPAADCGPLSIDQRGAPRPQIEGRPCDIGAVERPAPLGVPTSGVTTSTRQILAPTTTRAAAPTTGDPASTATTTSTSTTLPTTPPAPATDGRPVRPPASPTEASPRLAG